ncbi:MAG: NAD(P)H-hydrate dehydratase [Candidatus Marinimicrobia bacterium]|nr:NAD(P)H-hydrate dehydratase [Candidatus Neomarinimicrobiota bacterium]MBL7030448.1 NAD(P)H-hydrate dehydratase [Candidatus Neomarinimicrobiota bacterium]
MRLVTGEQSKQLDRLAMENHDISGETLMGNAGEKLAEFIRSKLMDIHNPNIGIVCGKGNNGGDGFAASDILNKWGFRVTIYSMVDQNEITGDAKIFLDRCEKNGLPIIYNINLPTSKPVFDLMVDAVLGTGFSGNIREETIPWIQWMNDCKQTVSADIPSGVNATTGTADIHAVIADHTVSMGYPKVGMTIEPGKSHSGHMHSVDIGFPEIVDKLDGRSWTIISEKEIQSILKPMEKSTHKHVQGKVLFVAGSLGMTGAAYLSTMGALRSGAGLTITCAPASLNAIYEEKITEGMTVSCEDDGQGIFTEKNYDIIMKWVDWCDVIAMGPGLGQNEQTSELVHSMVKTIEKPMVIDADGLRAFYHNPQLFRKINSDFVITPHMGELSQLTDISTELIQNDLPGSMEKFMSNFPGVLVAKFAPSLVAWKGQGGVNSTGNPGLATAGTGDVLTGLIASFMAQGFSAVEAAKLGVFIHGKAADQLAKIISQRGLIASDLFSQIGIILRNYES